MYLNCNNSLNIGSVKRNYRSLTKEDLEKYNKARDLEIKKRFEKLTVYRYEFIKLVNEVLNIDDEICETTYEENIKSQPFKYIRENDILLKAIGKNNIYTYFLVEAQTSKDYYIFDRLLVYYTMFIEKLVGDRFHDVTSENNVREIFKKVGIPVFVVITTGASKTYIKNGRIEPIQKMSYKKYRSQYDTRYGLYGTIDFDIVYINDEELYKVDDKYRNIIEYALILRENDINRLIYSLELSKEESIILKEGLEDKRTIEEILRYYTSEYIEEAREEAVRETRDDILTKINEVYRSKGVKTITLEEIEEEYNKLHGNTDYDDNIF